MSLAKSLDTPDRTLTPDHARMEFVTLDGATVMRATHEPFPPMGADLSPKVVGLKPMGAGIGMRSTPNCAGLKFCRVKKISFASSLTTKRII